MCNILCVMQIALRVEPEILKRSDCRDVQLVRHRPASHDGHGSPSSYSRALMHACQENAREALQGTSHRQREAPTILTTDRWLLPPQMSSFRLMAMWPRELEGAFKTSGVARPRCHQALVCTPPSHSGGRNDSFRTRPMIFVKASAQNSCPLNL